MRALGLMADGKFATRVGGVVLGTSPLRPRNPVSTIDVRLPGTCAREARAERRARRRTNRKPGSQHTGDGMELLRRSGLRTTFSEETPIVIGVGVDEFNVESKPSDPPIIIRPIGQHNDHERPHAPTPNNRLPRRRGFCSMRFGKDQVHQHEAPALKAALAKHGIDLFGAPKRGEDISRVVFEALALSDFFIAFATPTYGEDTGNPACTFTGARRRKRASLSRSFRMLKEGEEFETSRPGVLLADSHEWPLGSTRNADRLPPCPSHSSKMLSTRPLLLLPFGTEALVSRCPLSVLPLSTQDPVVHVGVLYS